MRVRDGESRRHMFHIATSDLMHLLTTYGYWAVLVFVAIESTGIPFPGETMLLVAAIYAGTTHQLFILHGGKFVFFGRFVAVLRAWAAFLAGTNRMRWPRFLFFNAAGGIVWATLYGLGGYLLGDNVHRLTGPVGTVALVLAVLVIIAFLVFLRRNEHRLEEEAERALPGPLSDYEPRGRGSQDEHSSRKEEVRRNTDVE